MYCTTSLYAKTRIEECAELKTKIQLFFPTKPLIFFSKELNHHLNLNIFINYYAYERNKFEFEIRMLSYPK